MKQIVFDEKTIEFLNGEKEKALDDIAVTIIHKDTLEQKDKEIKRLNNIINELEKYLRENLVGMDNTDDIKKIYTYNGRIDFINKTLDKLNELKGGSSNE